MLVGMGAERCIVLFGDVHASDSGAVDQNHPFAVSSADACLPNSLHERCHPQQFRTAHFSLPVYAECRLQLIIGQLHLADRQFVMGRAQVLHLSKPV